MTQTIQDQQERSQVKALSLYEQDFLLWSEDTVAKLKAWDFEHLDLESLIEEVESLGRSQKKELLSRLTRLFEHLLKRIYVDLRQNYSGWEQTIHHQRLEIELLIQDSPSLKSTWAERVDLAWKFALKSVRVDYPEINFPDRFPYSTEVETLLNKKYWEIK